MHMCFFFFFAMLDSWTSLHPWLANLVISELFPSCLLLLIDGCFQANQVGRSRFAPRHRHRHRARPRPRPRPISILIPNQIPSRNQFANLLCPPRVKCQFGFIFIFICIVRKFCLWVMFKFLMPFTHVQHDIIASEII